MDESKLTLIDWSLFSGLLEWMPLLVILFLFMLFWLSLRKVFSQQSDEGSRYKEQGARLLLMALGVLVAILVSPIGGELQGQLLSLYGILISATIALSSATVMGNLMAGIMLRVVNSFSIGDFVRVNGQLGKISGFGLLHVEIQTEDSDLVTMPNLVLIQQPFTVVRATGTVIHAEVSLGYDVNRHDIETALLCAVERAELEDGFILVRELQDFSVLYSVHGRLSETRQIVTARSRLRAAMLDCLHEAGIEIVSPSVVLQRQAKFESKILIPEARAEQERETVTEAEDLLFDKAEKAEIAHRLEKRLKSIQTYLEKLKKEKGSADEEARTQFKEKIAHWEQREQKVKALLEDVKE